MHAVDLLAFRCETGVEYDEMMGKTACYDIMPGSDNEGLFFLDRIKAFAQTIRRDTQYSSRWRETAPFLLVFQARS